MNNEEEVIESNVKSEEVDDVSFEEINEEGETWTQKCFG